MSSLEGGEQLLALTDLMVPTIQPLKAIFCTNNSCEDAGLQVQDVVKELTELASKMDALHGIMSSTSQMTENAWAKLQKLQYDVNLMKFFTQDFTCIYLQTIDNEHCDDPLETQRKCNLLMGIIADRM